MSKKILIALQSYGEYSDKPFQILRDAGVELVVNDLKHRLVREDIVQLGKDCQGIVAGVEPYDKEVLDKLSKLECLSRCGVGTDNIDHQVAKERQIAILNTPNVVIQPVAEMAVAMAFDLLRLLTVNTINLRSGVWKKKAGRLLAACKVGIVGLGRIGKRTAELFRALGAEVYGFDLYPDQAWAKKNSIKMLPLDKLLSSVDVLSLHVSVSKDNLFVLQKDELSSMKKGAVLINTSRGQVIDEAALYDVLRSGHLSGAGLDVYPKEPYQGPLRELDNVIMTPHVSTLTRESRAQMETEAVENILRHFNLL
ncbi:MAG: phosphoglycerate dehydrogenase [Pseudomonadota bacterium]